MTTLTEIVATVVVHSSAAALSHFGVTLAPEPSCHVQPAPVEHVVARTRLPAVRVATVPERRTKPAALKV